MRDFHKGSIIEICHCFNESHDQVEQHLLYFKQESFITINSITCVPVSMSVLTFVAPSGLIPERMKNACLTRCNLVE